MTYPLIVCLLFGGPDRYISVRGKTIRFEDHPRLGPVVLCTVTGEPATTQPNESHQFWPAYEAWEAQGKRIVEANGKAWCTYDSPAANRRKQIEQIQKWNAE